MHIFTCEDVLTAHPIDLLLVETQKLLSYPGSKLHVDLSPVAPIAAEIEKRIRRDGTLQSDVPFLSFLRVSAPTPLLQGMLRPSFCFVARGQKRMFMGKDIISYILPLVKARRETSEAEYIALMRSQFLIQA